MAQSNGFNLGQLLGPRSVIQADQLAADAGAGGVTTYTAIGDLPSSGLTSGDMAFVDSSDRLYIWTGAGWYNIAVVNQTPAIQSILDSDGGSSPFVLSNVGATTTITMIAADPDGFPVSYIAVADSDFNAMATLSQVSNVFTITPTAIENSTGTITFKASDGINLASEISTFTLVFSIPDPDFNSVSFLSNFNGADNGVNNTFIDGSTSAHAITANGNVTQGSFGPLARPDGEWAVSFDGASTLNIATNTGFGFGTGDFTIECWVNWSGGYGTSNSAGILGFRSAVATEATLIQITAANTTPKFSIYDGPTGIAFLSTTIVQPGTWYHVVSCRSGTTWRLFVNGVIENTRVSGSDLGSSKPLVIGSLINGLTATKFSGNISDIRVVKGTALYTSTFTPPTAPLTAITNTTLLTCQSNRFVDNSVSALPLTIVGNPAVSAFGPFAPTEVYDPAVNGASGYFDGISDSFLIDNPSLAIGSGPFTIEAFFNHTEGGGTLVEGWAANGGTQQFKIHAGAGAIYIFDPLGTNGGNLFAYTVVGSMPANTWNHIAWSRDASNVNRLFLNGALIGTATSTSIMDTKYLVVGKRNNTTAGKYKGYITDMRFVKGTAVYTAAFTPPTEPLTAITNTTLLLNMNNGKAIDGTAKNNLTLHGNVKLSSTQSKFGGTSLFFDGTFAGDYVTAPDNSDYAMGTGNFTIECWIYPTGAAAYSMIFEQGSTVSDISFGLKPTTLQPYLYAGGFVINGSSNAQLNVWQHIALVRNSGTITIYLNGISIGSTSTVYNYTSQKFMIGATTALTNFIKGYIDDFRISKKARYTSNFTPPTEPFPNLG